jgi:hypothetical protein
VMGWLFSGTPIIVYSSGLGDIGVNCWYGRVCVFVFAFAVVWLCCCSYDCYVVVGSVVCVYGCVLV